MTRRIAALRPSCASDLTTKSSQGDDGLRAAQAAADQALEERAPEGLGLARADVRQTSRFDVPSHDLPLALVFAATAIVAATETIRPPRAA